MDKKLIIYYLCILTGAVLSAFIGYFIGRRMGLHKRAAIIFVLFAIFTGTLGAVLMGKIQTLVMYLAGLGVQHNNLRIFGGLLFTPLFILFPVKYLAGDFDKVTDALCPGLYVLLGFGKLGCAVYGCCFGIPSSIGIYSRFLDTTVFPVQITETVLCFLIAAIMYFVVFRKNRRKGTAYPISLILYGVMRFFAEYLRYYPTVEKTLFFGMNFWQMFSVITVILGIVWLIYRYRGKSRGLRISAEQYE